MVGNPEDRFSQNEAQIGTAFTMIVNKRADQLLTQLLMETFYTLPSQNMHIRHLMKKFDAQNNFDKMEAI